jgi:hypothetical protein
MSNPRAPRAHLIAPAMLTLVGGLALSLPTGCAKEKPQARMVAVQTREVHPVLRGTIGAEVEFRGIEPVLVSGYGLVVGLNGTGGDVLPDSIAATMEREMGLMGITKATEGGADAISGRSPREVLRDKNVAVVLVQAAIPPGAPLNSTFDVYVQALNATSLEGGQLWTTDLRLGQANVFGGAQARRIAKARGPIFINPFETKETSNRVSGRVLAGGQVTNPLGIEMVLYTPSYARTRAIVSAINSRFPAGPGDAHQTARGRTGPDAATGVGGSIELRVPNRYRQNPGDFLKLVAALPVDLSYPELHARRYVETMREEPGMADELSWCLEALGIKALPYIRELYDAPEGAVQLAALRAGARLDDPLAVPHLKEIARSGRGIRQTRAIHLLGQIMNSGPGVEETLRELLEEKELSVRIAAYEALAGRAERAQLARLQKRAQDPDAPESRVHPTVLQFEASRSLSGRSIYGVERSLIAEKFFLDVVPMGDPLIYISQQGQPRVVLFGADLELRRPSVVTAWDNRLMIAADEDSDVTRIYYAPPTPRERPVTHRVKGGLPRLIEFMARKTTPEDPRSGLDLSYSQVVGALAAIVDAGATRAAFAKETDTLKLQVLDARSAAEITRRPESPEDRDLIITRPKGEQLDVAPNPDREPPKIVPIIPGSEEERKKAMEEEAQRVRPR